MKLQAILTKHEGMIKRTLDDYIARYEIDECDEEIYRLNITSDIWLKSAGVTEINSSWVKTVVYQSCVNTYRELNLNGRRNEGEMTVLYDDAGFSEEFCYTYCVDGVYCINGNAFPNLSELADLDIIDLAVIQDFLDTPVEHRSRRRILRRRVDLILLKLGIDSSEIYEYTSRKRC